MGERASLNVAMVTEREKMIAGELYDALDPELVALRGRARDLCRELNATAEPSTSGGKPSSPSCSAKAATACGSSRRSTVTMARTSGSGSVVTRDLPDDVFAAGNPCRVIRAIP